jgi:hypothetical protein
VVILTSAADDDAGPAQELKGRLGQVVRIGRSDALYSIDVAVRGSARLAFAAEELRPATPEDIQAAQLAQLAGGGL